MFRNLNEPAPDVVMQVTEEFRLDDRREKVDLSVGVYKDANNTSPIMAVVEQAEAWLLNSQTSKSYVGTRGNLAFNDSLAELLLGDALMPGNVSVVQTPGGVSALRLLVELAADANPSATVWVSSPTWGNHVPIIKRVGLPWKTYPYYDASNSSVNFEALCETFRQIPKGDVVLLQACCHNPTGADLTLQQWMKISEILLETGALPLVDIAYQGMGQGVDEDAAGLRHLASVLPEIMVATTCSKNCAIYRERAGIALVQTRDALDIPRISGGMAALAQANYGMPPDHGATVVHKILSEPDMRDAWRRELEVMRARVSETRKLVSQELRTATNGSRFDFIAEQQGLFSLLGLGPEQVLKLRVDHGVYLMGDGRCNLAGLSKNDIKHFATSVAAVISQC